MYQTGNGAGHCYRRHCSCFRQIYRRNSTEWVVFWTQTISYFQARTCPATMSWVDTQSTECAVFRELRLVSWMPRRTVIYSALQWQWWQSDSGDRVTVVFWKQTISYFQARTFPATMPWVGMQSTECVVFWKLRLVSWMPRRTRYAAVDVPAGHHRSTCYKHMGHSDSVNENIYQVPPAEAEILRVSAVLQQFDSIFFSFSVTVIIIVNLSIIFQLFCHFSYGYN